MNIYNGKVQLTRELYNKFKSHYPHHGDFATLMRKLLQQHLEELDNAKRNNG